MLQAHKRSSAGSSSSTTGMIAGGSVSKSSIMIQNITNSHTAAAARRNHQKQELEVPGSQRRTALHQRAATAKNRRSGLATPTKDAASVNGESTNAGEGAGGGQKDAKHPDTAAGHGGHSRRNNDDYSDQLAKQLINNKGRETSRTGLLQATSQNHYQTAGGQATTAGHPARTGSGLSTQHQNQQHYQKRRQGGSTYKVGRGFVSMVSDQHSASNNQQPQYAGGQHSGKAYFGRRSLVGGLLNINTAGGSKEYTVGGPATETEADIQHQPQPPPSISTDSDQRKDRKKLEDLIDSVWPKDPLRELDVPEAIEIGEFLDGNSLVQNTVSQSHALHLANQDSEIKSSLNRIKETELKLGDMISRHIKKRGPEKFGNSSFVVTNRTSFTGHHRAGAEQRKDAHLHMPMKGSQRDQARQTTRMEKKKRLEGSMGLASLDVAKKLKLIMDLGKDDGEDKIHQLECFRPREIFNINTHALFQPERIKDPYDSDAASDENEEEITALLRAQKEESVKPIGMSGNDTAKSAKIDLKAYRPDKSIDYNIRVMRSMINKAKMATNTTRSASLAQSRKEQLKMSKFIKKDSSHFAESKIAKETAEAIKYMNKRQPLTVQNSKVVDDTQLFSLPSKKNILKKSVELNHSAERAAPREGSHSPPKHNLHLSHMGQKAKFYRNVGSLQSSQTQQGPPQIYQITNNNDAMSGTETETQHKRGRSLKTTSQSNFNPAQTVKNQATAAQFTPVRVDHSASRQNFLPHHPSTYSRTGGSSAEKALARQAADNSLEASRSSIGLNLDKIQMRLRQHAAKQNNTTRAGGSISGIQAGSSDVGGASFAGANVSIQKFNPVVLNNPQIINNFALAAAAAPSQPRQQAQKRKVARTQKRLATAASKSQKRHKSQAKKIPSNTGKLKSNPSHGSYISASQEGSGSRVNHAALNRSANLSSALNFHPVIAEEDSRNGNGGGNAAAPLQAKRGSAVVDGTAASNLVPMVPGSGSGSMHLMQQSSTSTHQHLNQADAATMDQQNQRFYRHKRQTNSSQQFTGGAMDYGAGAMMMQDEPNMMMSRINEYAMQNNMHIQQSSEQPSVLFNISSEGHFLNHTASTAGAAAAFLNRKKSSAVVKVDKTVLEKERMLTPYEMMRILDARNADMGLTQHVNTDKCTPEELERLVLEFEQGGQGPKQRFKDYCEQKCVNRKLVLQGFSLGPLAAQEIASILAVNRDIVHVDLSKNNLQDEGVEALIRVIKNNDSIIHLDLTQNNITAKGSKKVFKALAQNFSLISLKIGNVENVSKNRVGVKAVPKLNKFLQASQILSFLDLRSTNLTDAGLTLLCQGLRGNLTIENLSLSKNDITSSGLEKFAPILPKTAIRDLDLSLNPLGNNGVRCLAENLFDRIPDSRRPGQIKTDSARPCKLVKLNLSETKFQEQGGYHLFKNLLEYHKIETLILDYNLFESNNMQMMSKFLQATRIRTFSINYCKLGDVGGAAIGEALANMQTRVLELRAKKNEFRDKSARAIAEALEDKSNIKRLDLSSNLINDSGGELIGLAIASNENLSHLNLRKNNLRATSGAMFAQSMKENKTLKCLKLQKNSININFLEQIDKYIERNNLYLLENSVIQLRHNREDYLSKRENAWKEVYEDRANFEVQSAKLDRQIKRKAEKFARIEDLVCNEFGELDSGLSSHKNKMHEKFNYYEDLKVELARIERKYQKAIEDKEYSHNQAVRLIEMCKETTALKKAALVEEKAKYEATINALDLEQGEGERSLKRAEKELQKVKDEIDKLIGNSKQSARGGQQKSTPRTPKATQN